MNRQARVLATVVSAAASVAVSGGFVYSASSAAFTASTSNPGSNWDTGSVTLVDDDGGNSPTTGTAMFNVVNMVPGNSASKCIVVTATTDVATELRLYSKDVTGTNDLPTKLNLTIERGSGGSFSDCTGFNPAAGATWTGPLSNLGAISNYTGGVLPHALGAGPTLVSYRVTYALPSSTGNEVQNSSAGATFVWETQTPSS